MCAMLSIEIEQTLIELGQQIRQARIDRDESQERFAARLGVTRTTLRRLEQGNPNATLGLFALALDRLDRLDDLRGVLLSGDTLFAKWDETHIQPKRKRARRKKAS